MAPDDPAPRLATVDDADEVAQLLHDFNLEYDTPSPGPEVLAPRLRELLAGPETYAVLAGRPSVAVALITTRPNVWYPGPVALLDELYVVPELRSRGIGARVLELVMETARDRGVGLVEINVDEADVDAQRFYARQGFSLVDLDTGERAFYLSREL
jgi:GNAT superfamily N-acetyltransferase